MNPTTAETKSETKTRTITLFDRRPIEINEDEWPVIAIAKDESNDFRHFSLRVRQNEKDARTIVYGIFDTRVQGERDRRGGELIIPPSDLKVDEVNFSVWDEIPKAIRRVGGRLGFSDEIIDECIADLPAEKL
jgi:hypothetical protein